MKRAFAATWRRVGLHYRKLGYSVRRRPGKSYRVLAARPDRRCRLDGSFAVFPRRSHEAYKFVHRPRHCRFRCRRAARSRRTSRIARSSSPTRTARNIRRGRAWPSSPSSSPKRAAARSRCSSSPAARSGGDLQNVSALQGGTVDLVVAEHRAAGRHRQGNGDWSTCRSCSTTGRRPTRSWTARSARSSPTRSREKNLVDLAYFELGFRNITNSKRPITKMEDIAGLKLRVLQSPLFIDTFSALGANPTPMPFPEVYSALEQKVVDGQENPVTRDPGQQVRGSAEEPGADPPHLQPAVGADEQEDLGLDERGREEDHPGCRDRGDGLPAQDQPRVERQGARRAEEGRHAGDRAVAGGSRRRSATS